MIDNSNQMYIRQNRSKFSKFSFVWSDDPITKRNISNLINKINYKLIINYKVIFTLLSNNVFKLTPIPDWPYLKLLINILHLVACETKQMKTLYKWFDSISNNHSDNLTTLFWNWYYKLLFWN